jgi:hypothetical protein
MASQPLNAEISVFRRVRTQVQNERHDPVRLLGRVRPKYVVVPSEEIRVLSTKDSNVTDAWRYGHPVVRYARDFVRPADLYASASGLDYPVRLTAEPRDLFIQKTDANVTDDIHQNARDV